MLGLHGFAQQGGHLAELAAYVNAPMVAPDLPGHGPDPHLPATMTEAVDRVVDLIDETGVSVVVGYSMGGRIGLRAVLRRQVDLLVLVSTSAGIRDEVARSARVQADAEQADRIEAEGMAVFLDEWDRLPMFAGLAARSDEWKAQERALRLENTSAGVAAALRGMGQGVTEPVADDELRSLEVPTVLLAGAADPPYVAEAERLGSLIPSAEVGIHPTAGHSLVSEDPGWVAMAVRRRL